MGMIDRYKKSGGFVQLLKLIETCGPAKQEKFLSIIHTEDPRWGAAIEQKLLSIKRVMAWPDETLAEIFSRVQELTLAIALSGFEEEHVTRVTSTFSHGQVRRIQDLQAEKNPGASEISAAFVKIIEQIRRMITEHEIRVEKFDVELVVEEDIEDKLNKGATFGSSASTSAGGSVAAQASAEVSAMPDKVPAGTPGAGVDILKIKKTMQGLLNENSLLKGQVADLEDRIAQIQKIAG